MHKTLPSTVSTLLDGFMDVRNIFFNDWIAEDFYRCVKNQESGLSVYEEEEQFFIEAALPGVHPEDIEVTQEKGVAVVKGKKREEEGKAKFYLKASSSFCYTIPLPDGLETNVSPEAKYKDGILKISFRKSKAEGAHKIEVKVT